MHACRVGNLLGQGNWKAAKLAGWLSVALGAISMAFCAILMLVFRSHLASIFVDDEEVRLLVQQIALIACFCEV